MELSVTNEELSTVFTKYHIHGLPFDASFNEFSAPDSGYPHDHPFDFVTHILSGGYIEHIFVIKNGVFEEFEIERKPNTAHYVRATDIHKIISLPNGHCITLMMPKSGHVRTSGFYNFSDGKIYHKFWNEPKFTLYSETKLNEKWED